MKRSLLVILIVVGSAACTHSQPEVPEQLVEAAKFDFAARLQVAVDDIDVAEARPVTWSNGAVGCAETGQTYPPAQVDGHLIVLQYLTALGNYHQAGSSAPFLCLSPTE